MNNKGVVL